MLAVDHVADASDGEADHGRGTGSVEDCQERYRCAASPYVRAGGRPEEAAPLADAALGEGEDAQNVAVEQLEVLPDVEQSRADQAEHDHPGDSVAGTRGVDPILAQEPQAEPGGGEDTEDGEDPMPRHEERADLEERRLQVDDDGQRHARHPIARASLDIATSFGSSASV